MGTGYGIRWQLGLRRTSPHRQPTMHAYAWAKRAIDLLVCLLSAPLILPLIAFIAVIVKLDSPGPVFFRQWRTGKHGRRFRLYKFRTMVGDAEARKADYAHLNEL